MYSYNSDLFNECYELCCECERLLTLFPISHSKFQKYSLGLDYCLVTLDLSRLKEFHNTLLTNLKERRKENE